MEVYPDKHIIRERLKQRRKEVTEAEYHFCSEAVCRDISLYCSQLRMKLQRSLHLFSYFPFEKELDIRPLLMECYAYEDQVYLPRMNPAKYMLTLHLTDEHMRFKGSSYGLQEPDEMTISLPPDQWSQLDIMIVPGIAFDRMGGRLGLGAGYYDRFWHCYKELIQRNYDGKLSCLDKEKYQIARISCLYSWQIVEKVPMEAHDIVVERLFTEQGVILCNH